MRNSYGQTSWILVGGTKDGILVLRNRKETNAIAGGDEEVEDVQD